jgi:acyl-CoA hydrolase
MSPAGSALIAYLDGVDSARSAPEVVAKAVGSDAASDAGEVLMGWTPETRAWLSSPSLRGRTVLAGYALSAAVAEGRLTYLPVRLSALPRLVADVLRPDIAVVTGVRRGGDLVFGSSVGWGPALARAASAVVVEIDEGGADLGGPVIPGHIVATLDRPAADGPWPVPRAPDDVDHQIGRNVISVLPEEPTLQFGPGGVADAIIAALDRPVRIWSGLVTDALAALEQRGLLLGAAISTYAWGQPSGVGEPGPSGAGGLARMAAEGKLQLLALEQTHDLTMLSAKERFVGCNTALQVGLDGTVNVERVAGRQVAGMGGHPDFCAAAVRSLGGMSIIALRSTTRRGASTIVPQVEVTSTPRCDVEVVVTEHGVADLRGVDDRERSRRIAQVAAPEHRASLLEAANASKEVP